MGKNVEIGLLLHKQPCVFRTLKIILGLLGLLNFVNYSPISRFLSILESGDQEESADTHIDHYWRPQIFDLTHCEAKTLEAASARKRECCGLFRLYTEIFSSQKLEMVHWNLFIPAHSCSLQGPVSSLSPEQSPIQPRVRVWVPPPQVALQSPHELHWPHPRNFLFTQASCG